MIPSKDLEILLGHVGLFPRYLMFVTVICTLAVAGVFFYTYHKLLKSRIEGEHSLSPPFHFAKNVISPPAACDISSGSHVEGSIVLVGRNS